MTHIAECTKYVNEHRALLSSISSRLHVTVVGGCRRYVIILSVKEVAHLKALALVDVGNGTLSVNRCHGSLYRRHGSLHGLSLCTRHRSKNIITTSSITRTGRVIQALTTTQLLK